MHFAAPIPLWLAAIVAVLIGAAAVFSYRRPIAPLSTAQRTYLIALRTTTLVGLLLLVCRPFLLVPPKQGDIVVPVLLDVSRSMRVDDADGQTRLGRATQIVKTLVPELSQRFTPEVYAIGEGQSPTAVDALDALRPDGRRSNLTAALDAIRDRYRGRRIAGIVLLSDGGDTTAGSGDRTGEVPVFTIGLGQAAGVPDREVIGVTAGEQALDQASVDLHVSAVSRGLGRSPFELTVRANGQLVETRRVEPSADGSPVDATFTVAPDSATPTVFTVEASAADGESIRENNSRAVMVSPAGRQRRLLFMAGAPGFDHSFLMRALAEDPGFEIDSVVRKGKNDDGRDTYVVQAEGGRAPKLAQGLPSRKEDFFAYDAVIIANVEGDAFTRAQLTLAAEFVGERGGGLLVLGGRSFARGGLMGTALEDVLPLELSDRKGSAARGSSVDRSAKLHGVTLTSDGAQHPVMRIASTSEETAKRWAALPTLASSAPLGSPRPGASVLAVTAEPGGVYPVVAVQRYGRGRSMVFGGEAAWRWRMLMPSSDRSYEYFWRQAARWLAGSAPDAVTVGTPDDAEPGDTVSLRIDARDAGFVPVADATVDVTLTTPSGDKHTLTPRQESGAFVVTTALDQPGLYRVHADARQGEISLGTADRWFYAGGSDRELADPRLNEGVLRRIARGSGGRYATAGESSQVAAWLSDAVPQTEESERRDLWHQPWVLGLLIAMMATEWTLRRRWGLR